MKKYLGLIFLVLGVWAAALAPQTNAASPTPTPTPTVTATAAAASPTPQATETILAGWSTPNATETARAASPTPNAAKTTPATAAAAAPNAAAPGATASPTPITSESVGTTIPLSLLGFNEQTMRGPFDSTYLAFSLPDDWELNGGATLQLDINTTFTGSGIPLRLAGANSTNTKGGGGLYNGEIQVFFNNVSVSRFSLDQEGPRTVTIPISQEALHAVSDTGRYSIQLILTAIPDCDYDWHTAVVVYPTSTLTLPHEFVPATTDLRQLPRPIYQGSFVQDTAVIVVPNQPTINELQSALAIAAGLGRMSSGKLVLELKPVAHLTSEDLKNSHLIFVGNPTDFAMLQGIPLPAPVNGSAYNAPNAKPTDGILQVINSPQNPSRVWLIAGGSDDAGVLKAGQALSTGIIKATVPTSLALVADVQPNLLGDTVPTDRTFTDLGYQNKTAKYLGTNFLDYQFYVPPGMVVTDTAYLDLDFGHSSLAEYERSGILVRLNDEPLGSVRFSDETAQGGKARVKIPRTAVRPGYNRLTLAIDLFPRFMCMSPTFGGLWATVRAESLLHMPLSPAPTTDQTPNTSLASYPGDFTTHPLLESTGFVLPNADPTAWGVASQIAFDLGNSSGAALPDLAVAFADAVPETLRQARDLIIIGRPSQLPIIGEMKDIMPAPFEPGSDLATERNMNVIYRIAPGTSVGYLEIFPAAWDKQRTLLTVLGSTDQGLEWAGNALTLPKLRGRLGGNYAFINGEQIVTGDTRLASAGVGAMATAVPEVTPEAAPIEPSAPPSTDRPAWILPVLGAAIVLLAGILLVVGISSLRQRARKT